MAENVGGIVWTAEMQTAQLVAAEKQVSNSLAKTENSFVAAGKSAQVMNTQMTKTASAVNQASSSMGNLRGVAGNLGFQLQDIAVQAQMGASAFTILGQQGSQIASAFGPGGAVFGAVIAIAAAIGGTLVAAMKNAGTAAEKLPEDLVAQLDIIKKKFEETDEASRASLAQVETGKITGQIQGVQDEIDILVKRAESFRQLINSTDDARSLALYKQQYADINGEIRQQQQRIRDLGLLQSKVIAESVTGKEGFEGITTEIENSVSKEQQLIQQLTIANVKTEQGELAAVRLSAAFLLGLTNAEQLPPAIDELIKKQFEAEQRQKSLNALMKQAEKDLLSELGAEQQQRNTVTTEFQQVQSGITSDLESPAQKAERELSERLAVIKSYAQQEYADKEAALQAQLDAEQAYATRIKAIRDQDASNRSATNMSTLSATADFFGNLASLAEQGGKDQFSTWKALASAQAAISATLAVLNVLANPAIPYPLNIGLAASMAALAGAQVAQIQGAQYSGPGRKNGGSVSAGRIYPVSEGGDPELLMQGGRSYLLPGAGGGNVVSAKDMQVSGGGGNAPIINITNYSGGQASVQSQRFSEQDKRWVLDVVVGDMNKRGATHKAVTGTTNAVNRTS